MSISKEQRSDLINAFTAALDECLATTTSETRVTPTRITFDLDFLLANNMQVRSRVELDLSKPIPEQLVKKSVVVGRGRANRLSIRCIYRDRNESIPHADR